MAVSVQEEAAKLESMLDGWEVHDEYNEHHLVAKEAKKKHVEALPRTYAKVKVAYGLYHNATQAFLGLVLMISLFLPDFWVIANPSNDDDVYYNLVLIVCFAVFTIEIFLL
jgi:hypothetical protein